MYSRNEIQSARRDLIRESNGGDRQQLLDIPDDAEYVGAGPLYVWSGSVWLDWNLSMADSVVRDREPDGGGDSRGSRSPLPFAKKRKKPAKKPSAPLFEGQS